MKGISEHSCRKKAICLEKQFGKKAIRNELPLQHSDVPNTWADCSELVEDFNYHPETSVEEGIERFVNWYKEYYRANDS